MVEDVLKIPKNPKEALNILGLQESVDKKEVEKAYKKYALKWHPDKWSNGSEEEKNKATENFKAVNVAHKILIGEITEEFISKQTNDDWVDELVKKFKDRVNELRKERHGSHLSEEEIDLFDALDKKDLEKTKSLLEKIKNINVQSKILDTGIYKAPLHYIVQNACEEPNNCWKTLLEAVLSKHNSSDLIAAHTSNTIAFSKSNIININIQCCHAGTPLHIACKAGIISVVQILLKYGADYNLVHINPDFKVTPLYHALRNNEADIAELLFAHGAKIDASYTNERSIIGGSTNYDKKTVEVIIKHTSKKQKSEMLQRISCSKEETDDHIKTAELLLKAGADPKFYGNKKKGEMPNSSSCWATFRKKAKFQELFSQYKTASNTTKQPTTTTTSQQKQPISGAQQTVTGNTIPFEKIPTKSEINNNLQSEEQDSQTPITTDNSNFLGISTRGWIIISTCAIVGGAIGATLVATGIIPAIIGLIATAILAGAAGVVTGGAIGGGMACLTKIVISKCCSEEAAAQPA